MHFLPDFISLSFMSTKAQKRLLRDLKKIKTSNTIQDGFIASPSSPNDLLKWNAVLFGADGSEWEGGVFHLSLEFSDEYPQVSPVVKFVSTIPFHPNIYSNGNICIDILQHNWSSAYDVYSILTAIQSLMIGPNPNSPANNEAAELYVHNHREYIQRVKNSVESTWEN